MKVIESGKINPEKLKKDAENIVTDKTSGLGGITNMMENNGEFMKDMMFKMAGFMGSNINPEQLNEMMENIDNPDKLQELATQMDLNNVNTTELQEKLSNMISAELPQTSNTNTTTPQTHKNPNSNTNANSNTT